MIDAEARGDALNVLKNHFRHATEQQLEHELHWFYPAFILGGPFPDGTAHMVDVVDRTKQREHVEGVRRAADALWLHFSALHGSVRAGVGGDLWNRILLLHYDVTGRNPQPWLKDANGQPIYPNKVGATSVMMKNLNEVPALKKGQAASEFASKVHLIDCTRAVWERLTGEEPAKKTPRGVYGDFVKDTILMCGKSGRGWTARQAMISWCDYYGFVHTE